MVEYQIYACTGGILERDAQFFEKLMAVNYMGVVHTLKAALPIMVEQKAGSCIVTNSTAGFAGNVGLVHRFGHGLLHADMSYVMMLS